MTTTTAEHIKQLARTIATNAPRLIPGHKARTERDRNAAAARLLAHTIAHQFGGATYALDLARAILTTTNHPHRGYTAGLILEALENPKEAHR